MKDQIAIIPPEKPLTTGDFIQAALAQGATESTVAVVERLCALREREEQTAAKRAFAEAFAELQAETPKIIAQKAVPNKDGTTRYTYAPYEEIMRKVQPILAKCGFAIRFNTAFGEGRVTVECTLIHRMGHSETNSFSCRVGNGPMGASEAQGDGAAMTYAKRFALCAALNIVIEQDTDARILGECITPDQAEALKARCDAAKVDVARFLKVAGAESFETITTGKFGIVDGLLRKKEAGK